MRLFLFVVSIFFSAHFFIVPLTNGFHSWSAILGGMQIMCSFHLFIWFETFSNVFRFWSWGKARGANQERRVNVLIILSLFIFSSPNYFCGVVYGRMTFFLCNPRLVSRIFNITDHLDVRRLGNFSLTSFKVSNFNNPFRNPENSPCELYYDWLFWGKAISLFPNFFTRYAVTARFTHNKKPVQTVGCVFSETVQPCCETYFLDCFWSVCNKCGIYFVLIFFFLNSLHKMYGSLSPNTRTSLAIT